MNVETATGPEPDVASPAPPVSARPAASLPLVTRLWRRVLREPSLAVTLGYVFVSFIGLWSSYWFYRGFHLPILEYMQASDFLVAGLRDPTYAVLLLASVGIAGLVSWPESYRRDRPDRVVSLRQRWWGRILFNDWKAMSWRGIGLAHETGIVAAVLGGLIAASATYVDNKGKLIRRDGAGNRVEVTLAGDRAPQPDTARLLGTSSAFVFLWWPERQVAEAVPSESIGRLSTVPRAHKPVARPPAQPAASTAKPTR